MLILLLKKKLRGRIEQAFLKLNLYKNKNNSQRLVAKYLSTILKFKIKINQAHGLQKLKNYNCRYINMSKMLIALSQWVKSKAKFHKILAFNDLRIKTKKSSEIQK